jgi:hypothetical protein
MLTGDGGKLKTISQLNGLHNLFVSILPFELQVGKSIGPKQAISLNPLAYFKPFTV